MVAHTYNPSTGEVEAGECESEVNLSYKARLYQKNQNQKKSF
jgi:hypothetical protein